MLIESRIVIANNDFARDLGVKLPGFGATRGNGTSTGVVGGGLPGDLDGSTIGYPGVEIPAGSGNQGLLVNLPQTHAWQWWRGQPAARQVGSYLLRLELGAMQQEGKGQIVSSPRGDHPRTRMRQPSNRVCRFPTRRATSSGATSVSFKGMPC